MQAGPHGSPSAWSPQGGSERSWAPHWPPRAIASSPPPASPGIGHRAEALLPGVPLVPPDEAAAGADLVLLAVPDDVLPGLVRGLAAAGCFRPGQIVVHTSGRQGVAVLDPAAVARRAAARPAPGDDLHRPGRGRRPARRRERRGDRNGR